MEHVEAVAMLANNYFLPYQSRWADLGCGSGTFTLALADLLQPQSIIYAIDKDAPALQQIPSHYNEVNIEKITTDFSKQQPLFNDLDGILMANSLHYIKDKNSFIKGIANYLAGNGCLLIVEYDTNRSNQWVPYPLDFSSLTKLFMRAGFSFIKEINEKPSLFRQANLYSVIIRK